jgi:hypothetical protein
MNIPDRLKSRFAALCRKRELDTGMYDEMRSRTELRTQENLGTTLHLKGG